jgi:ubiquinone/menaquinone biosynthesis C-methylase UbiE
MTNSDLTNLVLDKKYACLLELIDANKEDKILVIGTGVCPKIEFFLSSKYDCTDITSGDIDKSNVENGKLLLPKFEFMHLDAQKRFKFKNNSFDKIIFTDVLEHLKDEKIALQEIRRILFINIFLGFFTQISFFKKR